MSEAIISVEGTEAPTVRSGRFTAADGVRLVVLLDRRGRMVDEIGMENMENALPNL